MIIGTTPTFTFKLKNAANVNLLEVSNIYITLKQGTNTITKTGNNIQVVDATTVKFFLTQTESLQLTIDKNVELQMNWTYSYNGTVMRAATKVISINLDKQLLKQELS